MERGVTTVQFFPHELYLLAEACDAAAMPDGRGLMPLYEALAACFDAAMMGAQLSWESAENERRSLEDYRRRFAERARRHDALWGAEGDEGEPPAA